MAHTSISDEFPDIPFWTNLNGIELANAPEMTYTSSEFSSGRNSLTSDTPTFYHYANPSSKTSTPEDSAFGYQLPSPMEDESLIDPATVDKERRREQNRVAQRAFRERKETKLKHLEKRISEMKAEHRSLEKKYNNLRTAHLRLQSGLRILLDASGTFDGEETDSNGPSGDKKSA